MKIYFSLLILALFVSCTKDNDVKDLKKEIVGTWELELKDGMLGYRPQPAGNGQIIVLSENGSFERRKYDTLLFSGKYVIGKRKDCVDLGNDVIFSTNEIIEEYWYVDITDGKLTFNLPNCIQDGHTNRYRRLK